MTTQYLPVDGGRLAYSEHGNMDGESIFLIHGWMESRVNWKTTLACLETEYRCITVDLMGFGESDKPRDGDYSIEAQGKRVVALADALGLEKFWLIGHSMGGMIALYIAAVIASERVISVVSLAGVVSGKLHPMTMNTAVRVSRLPLWAMNTMANISRGWRHKKWWAYQQFKASFYDFDAVPFDLWAEWREATYLPGLDIPMKRAAEAILAIDITPYLKDIMCPTLAIFGRQDHVVLPSDGQLVADHVPQGRVVLYDDCGHFPNWEKREQYESDLMAFLHE
jgi:4,5:9,10-diseco-3-hydroxy-5,9,17-trioxoandrosta-1(10),2-diene-4-oate hydrolase